MIRQKLLILIAIGLFVPIYLTAQTNDLDKLMTRRQIDCRDIAYNCWFLIPEYYQKGRLDSVQILMDYWEDRCSMDEELSQTKFLISVINRTFDDKKLDINIFREILLRNTLNDYSRTRKSHYYSTFSYQKDKVFGNFIDFLGNKALSQALTKTEVFLVKSYIDTLPTQLIELENKSYDNTKIQNLYYQYKEGILKKSDTHLGFYTGYFSPIGSNKVFGNKGIFGLYLGYQFNKNQIDLLLDFKFGRAKESYEVVHQGKLVTTNEYAGLYLGMEYKRILIRKSTFDFSLLTGGGGERIVSIYADKTNNVLPKFFWSPTFNGGFGFRHYYNNHKQYDYNIPYWGLQMRFNYLNFINKGGTDISGNAFSIRLIWGISNNSQRKRLYKN